MGALKLKMERDQPFLLAGYSASFRFRPIHENRTSPSVKLKTHIRSFVPGVDVLLIQVGLTLPEYFMLKRKLMQS